MRKFHLAGLAMAALSGLTFAASAGAQQTSIDIDAVHNFLRTKMVDGVYAETANSWSGVNGQVIKVAFASDQEYLKPGQSPDPCIMVIAINSGGRNYAVGINFAQLEGIASIGGEAGFVNPAYSTSIFINGKIFGANSQNQLFDYHTITFKFHMMTMRDRTAHAMQDLQTYCTRDEGPY